MESINLDFTLNGGKVLEPKNWKGLREVWEYGNNSNQPIISAEKFEFQGDGAKLIYDHYNSGKSLTPISLNAYYTQPKASDFILKDYIIDLTQTPVFKGVLFNQEINPSSVEVAIRKKDSVEDLQLELQGITWALLEKKGAVNDSYYKTVRTAVMPLYNFVELGLAVISFYIVRKQIEDLIEDTKNFIIEAQRELSGLDPAAKIGAIIWIALQLAFRIASYIILAALLIKTIIDLFRVLLPPVVKNKGMTFRRGLDAIFGYLDVEYECKFPEIEYETILPSKPSSNEERIFDGLFTVLVANEKGYPNNDDFGYIASDYLEAIKIRFNARVDFIDGKVYIRKEEDDALFSQSNFKEHIDTNYNEFYPNIESIPNTTVYSFLYDSNDEYTYENKKGNFYEVKNISKDGFLPFKGLQRVDIPYALGNSKGGLVGIEKMLLIVAKVGDSFLKLTGSKPTLEKKIKKDRVNILKVSHNNYSVAKLLPLKNGELNGNNRNLLSARVIENGYYKNRRLSENGQKLIFPNVRTPFNMQDRENIKLNGNFVNSLNLESTFKSLDYTWAKDFIDCEIEVRKKYLAEDSYEEIFIEP